MSSPTNTPQDQAQRTEAQRPPHQPETEAPQSATLLDRIVSESQIAQRDAIIIRRAEFDQKQRLARMFANSGCFQDIDKDEHGEWLSQETSIARALIKIELGEAMGFSPAESMTGVDIIKGRIAVGASLRAARMQRAGYSWPQMILTAKGCWMPLCFHGEPMMAPKTNEDGVPTTDAEGRQVMAQVTVSFTENDARLLGLLDKNQSMYKKDPSSMYFARTVTRAQRRYGPGVLGVDALDTHEARDLADDERTGTATPTESEKQTVQERIDKAEANFAARTREKAQTAPAKAETAKQEPTKQEPVVDQPAPAEEVFEAEKEPVDVNVVEVPDAFQYNEGDRIRLLDSTVLKVVDGGWKIQSGPKRNSTVSLPKRTPKP